jgi:hypothetical protein
LIVYVTENLGELFGNLNLICSPPRTNTPRANLERVEGANLLGVRSLKIEWVGPTFMAVVSR